MNRKISKYIEKVVIYLVQILVTIMFGFPLYWMITTAFKPESEYIQYPPVLIPQNPTLDHIKRALNPHMEYGGSLIPLRNSLVASSVAALLIIVLGALAAYSFSRFKTGGDNLPFFILTMRMMPPIAAVIPIFLLMKWVNLLDNVLSLIIVYTVFNLPFGIWMLKGFIDEVPVEIEESAALDGCSKLRTLIQITGPLLINGIVVTGIFSFIFSWNEFLFALILTRVNAKTLPVHLSALHVTTERAIEWGPLSATALVASIPVFIVAFIARKYIVRGLTLGAVK